MTLDKPRKRNVIVRFYRRVRYYNSRLKPPFKQIVHGLLYVVMVAISLLLLALFFLPGLQVLVAGIFSTMISNFFAPAFMMSWIPVRVARKLVTFSVTRVLKRTRYYQIVLARLKHTVLFPDGGLPEQTDKQRPDQENIRM